MERRLAAILVADVAGYSRLTGVDEEGTLSRYARLRAEVIDPAIADHSGRVFKTTGDGVLACFPSVVEAVRCAAQIQQSAAEMSASTPSADRIVLRIGIHVGDVVSSGDDLLGEAVNIAARLEPLATPGGRSRPTASSGGPISSCAPSGASTPPISPIGNSTHWWSLWANRGWRSPASPPSSGTGPDRSTPAWSATSRS